jgi:hypothetical protein
MHAYASRKIGNPVCNNNKERQAKEGTNYQKLSSTKNHAISGLTHSKACRDMQHAAKGVYACKMPRERERDSENYTGSCVSRAIRTIFVTGATFAMFTFSSSYPDTPLLTTPSPQPNMTSLSTKPK